MGKEKSYDDIHFSCGRDTEVIMIQAAPGHHNTTKTMQVTPGSLSAIQHSEQQQSVPQHLAQTSLVENASEMQVEDASEMQNEAQSLMSHKHSVNNTPAPEDEEQLSRNKDASMNYSPNQINMQHTAAQDGENQPSQNEDITRDEDTDSSDCMKAFKEDVTQPLQPSLLNNPSSKKELVTENNKQTEVPTRSSPRLKNKMKKPKPAIKMAQEVLARKWGMLKNEEEMDNLTLQQYLDIYRKPLSCSAMAAIKTLSEVAELKKVKKKKKSTRGASKPNKNIKATGGAAVGQA